MLTVSWQSDRGMAVQQSAGDPELFTARREQVRHSTASPSPRPALLAFLITEPSDSLRLQAFGGQAGPAESHRQRAIRQVSSLCNRGINSCWPSLQQAT